MDLLEYGVLLGGSFFFGLVPLLFLSLLRSQKVHAMLSVQQKEHIVEFLEKSKTGNYLITIVCGIHFLTLCFEFFSMGKPFKHVSVLVPLTYVLMILLLAYITYRSGKLWISNLTEYDFPKVYMDVQEKHSRTLILGYGITMSIFLIGWFVLSKIELLKIAVSLI